MKLKTFIERPVLSIVMSVAQVQKSVIVPLEEAINGEMEAIEERKKNNN